MSERFSSDKKNNFRGIFIRNYTEEVPNTFPFLGVLEHDRERDRDRDLDRGIQRERGLVTTSVIVGFPMVEIIIEKLRSECHIDCTCKVLRCGHLVPFLCLSILL